MGTGFTGGEDAGVVHFWKLRPQDVWALWFRVGKAFSEARPPARRKLVERRPAVQDVRRDSSGRGG